MDYIAFLFGLDSETVENIFDVCAELDLISAEKWEEREIYFNNLVEAKYVRNYFKKQEGGSRGGKNSNSTRSPSSTPSKSAKKSPSSSPSTDVDIDVDKEVDVDKEKPSIKETVKSAGLKEKADQIFRCWNKTQAGVKHRNLTPPMKKSVNARLKDGYSVKEINQAIQNLSKALNNNSYYWTHRWTLQEFLSRGQGAQVDKFLDGIDDMLKDGAKKQSGGNGKMSLNEWMDFKGYEGQPNQDHILEYEGRYQN